MTGRSIDDGPPAGSAGHKPGALSDLQAFFTKHKTESLAAGGAAVVGFALLHRRNAASSSAADTSSSTSPVPSTATDTTGNDVPATYGYPTDSSPTGAEPGNTTVNITVPTPAPASPAGRKPKPKPKPKPIPKPKPTPKPKPKPKPKRHPIKRPVARKPKA